MLTTKQLKQKQSRLIRRASRVRGRIEGTAERPRLSIFRSARHIVAQLIDDTSGRTLAYVTDAGKKGAKTTKGTKTDKARVVGETIAEAAKKIGVKSAVFDRGGFRYHGRVKTVAEAARGKGLTL
ncbi:MAG: 50S ribosomal protein L18 [Patescibacteria group bacterium]